MKRIINGKKYDTGTAACVAEWSNGRGQRDFSRVVEVLYRKKTGEYFLYGEGGAASCYAFDTPQGHTSGEKIVPLSEVEALRWAEEHIEAEEYEAIFGEVEE